MVYYIAIKQNSLYLDIQIKNILYLKNPFFYLKRFNDRLMCSNKDQIPISLFIPIERKSLNIVSYNNVK